MLHIVRRGTRGAKGTSAYQLLMLMGLVAHGRKFHKRATAVADKPGGLIGREFRALRRSLCLQAIHALISDDMVNSTELEELDNLKDVPAVRVCRVLPGK